MVEVIWTKYALANLNEIADFIARDSPKFAQLTVKKLYNKVDILCLHPKLGRIVPELENENVRELIEGNYRIIYEIENNRLNILTVHHSSRMLKI